MAGTCGRFRLFLDNLGCVYMLDGAADSSIDRAFSQEGRAVHAGSPVTEPQRVALQISIMGFSCRPCGGLVSSTCDRISVLSLGADSARLSAAALPLPLARRALGPTPSTTLLGPSAAPPFTGCFCSKYFHPEAAWIDAAACQWCTAFPPAAPGCRGASRKTRTPRPCPPPDSLGVSPSRCWVRRALQCGFRGPQLPARRGRGPQLPPRRRGETVAGLPTLSAALRHVSERSTTPYVLRAVHFAATAGAMRAAVRRIRARGRTGPGQGPAPAA